MSDRTYTYFVTAKKMDLFPLGNCKKPFEGKFDKLRGHQDENGCIWLACEDVYRELGNRCSKRHIAYTCKKLHEFVLPKVSNVNWNSVDRCWETYENSEAVLMCPELELTTVALKAVERLRKTVSQKQNSLAKFNISGNVRSPIECTVLDYFWQACPYDIELQYRLGKYVLDAYIPALKIAIQIDENDHKGYCENEEKQYNSIIRNHGIVCIRYNPSIKNPIETALGLIKLVWERTLSPDFAVFRKK